MKNNKNCKIVQDLLPNYIENLIAQDTNLFVEEHLKECVECKEIYGNMRKEIKTINNKNNKREINYFKKYNNKMKILKLIIFVILIVYALVLGRRAIIISSLQNKVNKIKQSTNYHIIQYDYEGVNYRKNEVYHKDGKTALTIENGETKITKISNGNKANLYIDAKENKIAMLNKNAEVPPNYSGLQNYVETNSIREFIVNLFTTKITTANINGKECYKIDGFYTSEIMHSEEGRSIYIDKETGLPVRTFGGTFENEHGTFTIVNDYQYEFNKVDDNVFIEPNINEYQIQQ